MEEKKSILNTLKIVVMVFGCKAMKCEDVNFFFKRETIPVKNEFVYLGVKFTSNGKFSGHLDLANARGRYIRGEIARSSLRRVRDIRVYKRIWTSKIVLAMHYGAEVWGYRKGPKLEVVMMKYYKRMLGLGDLFSNVVIQRDLGLASLRSKRLVTIVRYWVRILGMQRLTVAKAAHLEALRQKSKAVWPAGIKDILDKCGLGELWNEGKGIMGRGNSNKGGTRVVEEPRNSDMVGKSGSFRVVKIV